MYTTSIATISSIHRFLSEFWNAFAVPWKLAVMVPGSVARAADPAYRVAQGNARLQIERHGHRRQLPEVVDRLRPALRLIRVTVSIGTSLPSDDRR